MNGCEVKLVPINKIKLTPPLLKIQMVHPLGYVWRKLRDMIVQEFCKRGELLFNN